MKAGWFCGSGDVLEQGMKWSRFVSNIREGTCTGSGPIGHLEKSWGLAVALICMY